MGTRHRFISLVLSCLLAGYCLSSAKAATESESLLLTLEKSDIQGPVLAKADEALRVLGYRRADDVVAEWASKPSYDVRMMFKKTLSYRLPQGVWEVPQNDGSVQKEKYSALYEITIRGMANPRRPSDAVSVRSVEVTNVGFVKD